MPGGTEEARSCIIPDVSGLQTSVHVADATARRPSRAAGVEVGLFTLGMLLLLWDVWEFLPFDARGPIRAGATLLLLVALVGSFVSCRVRLPGLGLSAQGLRSGWGSVAAFTVFGGLTLVPLGLVWGEPSTGLLRRQWLMHYVAGVAGQQIALQVFLNNRLFELASSLHGSADAHRFAIVGSALMFAAFHAPNLWLVVVTLAAGLFWTWHFRRHGNLPALVISQAVLGAGAMLMLGEGPLMNLRVGWGAMKLYLGV